MKWICLLMKIMNLIIMKLIIPMITQFHPIKKIFHLMKQIKIINKIILTI